MIDSRPLRVAAAIGPLIALATGCGESPVTPAAVPPVVSPVAPEPEPIVIAATYSETGRHQKNGTELAIGYRLAVEMLNENGGIRGREVRLELVDDESDPATAAQHYSDFVTSDAVDAILGPYSSPITEAVMEVTEAAGWPMVAALASAPQLWQGRERRWSLQLLSPSPSLHQGALALAVGHGARTIALVYENSPFPVGMATGVRDAATTHGLEIVLDRSYEIGDADPVALVSAARKTGADVFVGGVYYPEALALANAVVETGYVPMLVSLNAGADDAQFGHDAGGAAACVVGNARWLPGVRTGGFIADNDTFVQRHRSAYGALPDETAAAGFGAVELVAEAMETTLDAAGEIDRAAMRDHLFGSSSRSVLGPFAVAPLGDRQAGAQLALTGLQVQWQDDGAGGLAQRIVHPPEHAEAEPCFLR